MLIVPNFQLGSFSCNSDGELVEDGNVTKLQRLQGIQFDSAFKASLLYSNVTPPNKKRIKKKRTEKVKRKKKKPLGLTRMGDSKTTRPTTFFDSWAFLPFLEFIYEMCLSYITIIRTLCTFSVMIRTTGDWRRGLSFCMVGNGHTHVRTSPLLGAERVSVSVSVKCQVSSVRA